MILNLTQTSNYNNTNKSHVGSKFKDNIKEHNYYPRLNGLPTKEKVTYKMGVEIQKDKTTLRLSQTNIVTCNEL